MHAGPVWWAVQCHHHCALCLICHIPSHPAALWQCALQQFSKDSEFFLERSYAHRQAALRYLGTMRG